MSCAKTKKSQSFCVWSNVPPYFCAALCPKNQHQGRRIMWATASVAHIISFPDVVFPKKSFLVTRATHLFLGFNDFPLQMISKTFSAGTSRRFSERRQTRKCPPANTDMSSSQAPSLLFLCPHMLCASCYTKWKKFLFGPFTMEEKKN